MTELKEIIIHEIGHWIIGNTYGLDGYIYKQDDKHYSYILNDNLSMNKEDLEKTLTLSMGGLAANEICGHKNSGQYLGDILVTFNHIKKYEEMNNKEFPYEKPGHVPLQLYAPFLEKAKKIIEDYGGKEYLEAAFEHLTKND
ncbi:MAG: hypothetical protein QXK76_04010 [Candidatus Woesearchaeota archaeon]